MMDYDWPENVRELEGAIERACTHGVRAGDPHGRPADAVAEPSSWGCGAKFIADATTQAAMAQPAATPRVTPLAELEKQAILTTIRQLKGDKLMAARLLGIGKTTLYRKLKEYGLSENVLAGDAGTDERDKRIQQRRAVKRHCKGL